MPPPKGNDQGRGHPNRPKKDLKTFEFKVYRLASGYTGDFELIATIEQKFKNVTSDGGRPITIARHRAEEFARNIGIFGITVETPEGFFNYYPPSQIAKVEYSITDE